MEETLPQQLRPVLTGNPFLVSSVCRACPLVCCLRRSAEMPRGSLLNPIHSTPKHMPNHNHSQQVLVSFHTNLPLYVTFSLLGMNALLSLHFSSVISCFILFQFVYVSHTSHPSPPETRDVSNQPCLTCCDVQGRSRTHCSTCSH